MQSSIKTILDWYKEISLLEKVRALLDWDMNVNLPKNGSQGRGEQSSLIAQLVTERWLDKKFVAQLTNIDISALSAEEKAIVQSAKRLGKYYLRVPRELILKKASMTTNAFMIWAEAKKNNNFADFVSLLTSLVSIDKEIASYLSDGGDPYDALLDLYEPGLSGKTCKQVICSLQPTLSTFLEKIISSSVYKNKKPVTGVFTIEKQHELVHLMLKKMSYDLSSGCLHTSSHPFTTTLDRHDVRITTRYNEHDYREALTSTIHEAGHALYELGVDERYSYTPLEGGVSMAIHESQSRFWENQVGRNPAYLLHLLPFVKDILGYTIDHKSFVLQLNDVKRSFIRTEADELTYPLHIMLRFEIESELINEGASVRDLPQMWNEKMKKYLGVIPPNDREGVLQDVHWAYGAFGYFPSYALGNIYAAQFAFAMKKELNFDGLLQTGDTQPILDWLRVHIHRYGGRYLPEELIKKVTGSPLTSSHYLEYLKDKYSKIYETTL